MNVLLSPKMDFIFKQIFGNEKHPNILISFLNAILEPSKEIVSVELKDTNNDKEFENDKFSRIDVRAVTSNNEHINIEIQRKDENDMVERTLYYWSKLYTKQLKNKGKYRELNKTICINILDFNLFSDEEFPHYHNKFRLNEVTLQKELTDKIEVHFVELNKIKEVKTLLDTWVEFIRNPESNVITVIESNNAVIKEAKEQLVKISMDEEQRSLYEKKEKILLDERSALYNAELKGEQKGLKKGLEEGVKRGLEKTALNLINKGFDNEFIVDATGLSNREVEVLRG